MSDVLRFLIGRFGLYRTARGRPYLRGAFHGLTITLVEAMNEKPVRGSDGTFVAYASPTPGGIPTVRQRKRPLSACSAGSAETVARCDKPSDGVASGGSRKLSKKERDLAALADVQTRFSRLPEGGDDLGDLAPGQDSAEQHLVAADDLEDQLEPADDLEDN